MTFDEWLARFGSAFPRLTARNARPTSPNDDGYNCVAWAASDTQRWWWPDPLGVSYWPAEVPREETMRSFEHAFALRGFRERSNPLLEPGKVKVAIYAGPQGAPTHAARQLADGWWASKLGESIDIEHEFEALDGPVYGNVAVVLARDLEPKAPLAVEVCAPEAPPPHCSA